MPNYKHFMQMTDEIGILQFSIKDNPDPMSGYTLDDNARALIATLFMGEKGYPYACRFVDFMTKTQQDDGRWFNFFLNGKYFSTFDSEDSVGRAFLACSAGTISSWPDISNSCSKMINRVFPRISFFSSPRAIAYILVGLCKGKFSCSEKELHKMVNRLSNFLINLYQIKRSKNWLWFEDYLTYCNAILPHALFCVYAFNNDKKALKIANESLNFLNDLLFSKGYLNIVGNQGWYHRNGTMPVFDQQPVDAASIALANWDAYHIIGKKEYLYLANLAHQWYRGKNIHGIWVYNETTGGCYDALTKDGINLNQGSEAVLSLLLSDLIVEQNINLTSPEPPIESYLKCLDS